MAAKATRKPKSVSVSDKDVRPDALNSRRSQSTVIDHNGKAMLSDLNNIFRHNEAVDKVLAKNLSVRAISSAKSRKRVERAFANFSLSSVSDKARKDPSYFDHNDNLTDSLQAIIKRDIAELANSNIKHSLRLTLSDDDIKKYNLTKTITNGATKISGSILLDDILSKIEGKSPSYELYSRDTYSAGDSSSICTVEAEAERRIKEITNKPGSGASLSPEVNDTTGTGGSASPIHPSAEKLVKEKVDLQMQTVTSPETQLSYGVAKRADENVIKNTIEAFEIKGGPADVTSYHDFYRLKIAFENIWTEVFDGQFVNLAKDLYKMYVERIIKYPGLPIKWVSSGGDSPYEPIGSAQEFKEIIYRLRRLSEIDGDPRLIEVKKIYPAIQPQQWYALDDDTKKTIYDIVVSTREKTFDPKGEPIEKYTKIDVEVAATKIGQILQAEKLQPTRLEKLLNDLDTMISTKSYAFKIFAPKSVNFGVLVTYRQIWEPLNYQVGNLVKTIPLAPQEVLRYTTKTIEKKKRSVKELDDALQIRKKESSSTSRVEAEIVQKASNKSDFKTTAEGSMTIGVANIHASQSIGKDASKESSEIKKQFREEVLKAAEEYKHEHKTEVSTEESQETEFTTSHEIKNPNDELPVTFLFYELQRSFQISEKIHKLTPVVLVANSVPAPNEINESWLLTHDWILKRVILDDSFLPALEYLSKSLVGAELSLEIHRINMEKQMKIVEQIGQQVDAKNQALLVAQSALSSAIEKYSKAQKDADSTKRDAVSTFFDPINIADKIAGGDKPDYDSYRLSISSAQEALDRAQRQADDLRSQLQTEMSALQVASDKYCEAMEDHFNHQTQTDKLRVHIKDNVLYYMQAIWNHEPPDQRFFRLFDQEVPVIEATSSGIRVDVKAEEWKLRAALGDILDGKAKHKVAAEIPVPTFTVKYKKLVDIADLDNLLGYKGNYMIFPLKENNYLTHYMMQDYIDLDQIVSLRDPDEFADHSTDELQEFMKCEYRKNPRRFRQNQDYYKEVLIRRLSSPIREKDIVVVPTTSLYLEALPGKHPLLEDFKLIHRALDVKKVQAEVRHAELENVRLASRALKGKDEDPDIEKKIIIEGDHKDVVISPDDS